MPDPEPKTEPAASTDPIMDLYEGGDGQAPDPEPAYEDTPEDMAAARRQGWRPADEFNRPPEDFKSAKDFLAVSENELPVLRNRLKALDARVEAQDAAIKFANSRQDQAVQAEHDRLMQDFEDKKRASAEIGDTAEYDKLVNQQAAVAPPESPEPPKAAPVEDPAVTAFKANNAEWWDTDKRMTRFAITQSGMIGDDNPEWNDEQIMTEVQKVMDLAFPPANSNPDPDPDPDPDPEPRRTNRVEPRGRVARRGTAKSFSTLPAADKAGFQVAVDAGMINDDEDGRKMFSDTYWAEQSKGE